jgi:hypothetical protein
MRDGWTRAALGDITTSRLGKMLSKASKTGVDEYPYLRNANVQWNRLDLDDLSTMAFSAAERVEFELRAGDVLICEGGEVGRALVLNADLPGIYFQKAIHRVRCTAAISPAFLVLYLQYLAQTGGLADYSSQLTIQHLTGVKLRTLPIEFPPLAEQRRIVDLVDAASEVEGRTSRVVGALSRAHVALVLAAIARSDSEGVRPDELLDHVIGGTWGSAPGQCEHDVLALGTSAFRGDPIHVDPATGTPRSLSRSKRDIRSLRRFDIVLERSGGADGQPVGRVLYADRDLPDAVPSDFMRLLRVDANRADPRFVFWSLWARYHAGATLPFQTMTTNVRNLRIPDYLAMPLALPSRPVQEMVVELAEGFCAATRAVRAVARPYASLRAALLVDLVSGKHEISPAYDSSLGSSA